VAPGSHVKIATRKRDTEETGTSGLQQPSRDEEETPMARQKIVVGMLLLGLALPLASCASTGKVRMSSSSMSVRTAQQNCEQSHGYYDAAAQVCELGRE
jgi:hypothetical protein